MGGAPAITPQRSFILLGGSLGTGYPSDRHGYTESKSDFIRAAEQRILEAGHAG